MIGFQSLSVVMPTWNCAAMMGRHLEAMNQWVDLADEVICVDSMSGDGTVEMIKAGLRTDRLRLIIRGRGLYESWNEGISATTGDLIYISTAGDTIEREQLIHLGETLARAKADVVISPPRFVDEEGRPLKDQLWPPSQVTGAVTHNGPFVLSQEETVRLSYHHFPSALLGSSASNLYRGAYLRDNLFPTGFRGAGDAVWMLRNAERAKVCLTPVVGSTFCVHAHEGDGDTEAFRSLLRLLEAEKERCQANICCEALRGELEALHSLTAEVASIRRRAGMKCRSCLWPLNIISWLGVRAELAWARAKLRRKRKRGILPVKGLAI